MADIETFRAETRSWLEENAPKSLWGFGNRDIDAYTWGGRNATFASPDHKVWMDVMAEKQWTAPTWPVEYGGGGLNKREAKVLAEEIGRLKLPAAVDGFGFTMIGPVLLQFGNEEQKKSDRIRMTDVCKSLHRLSRVSGTGARGQRAVAEPRVAAIRFRGNFFVAGPSTNENWCRRWGSNPHDHTVKGF